jgi:hypothetical protein
VIWILIAGPLLWWALVQPVLNHEKFVHGPGPTLIESIMWLMLGASGPPALLLVIGLVLGWVLKGFLGNEGGK